MRTAFSVWFSFAALLMAFVGFGIRIYGLGVYQDPGMHCAGRRIEWDMLMRGFALAALALAPTALALESLRRRRGPALQGREAEIQTLMVNAPAAVAILAALFAILPTVCM